MAGGTHASHIGDSVHIQTHAPCRFPHSHSTAPCIQQLLSGQRRLHGHLHTPRCIEAQCQPRHHIVPDGIPSAPEPACLFVCMDVERGTAGENELKACMRATTLSKWRPKCSGTCMCVYVRVTVCACGTHTWGMMGGMQTWNVHSVHACFSASTEHTKAPCARK